MSQQITIKQPDDWHLHVRDGAYLSRTVPDAAKQFHRAIIMPNLTTPVTQVAQALAYRERILNAVPPGQDFEPLMTLYLTDETTPEHIALAAQCPHIYACKLYPANSTTHAQSGVTSIQNLYPVFERMQSLNLPLLIHGETPCPDIDIFDREAYFIDHDLSWIVDHFPQLRVVLEHISTEYAVNTIKNSAHNLGATITAHHLLIHRNHLLTGGIRPHYYCLPIAKTQKDQRALIEAATSGNPRFFLGTDSAPHRKSKKESPCGCAGIYTGYAAIALYLEVFDHAKALDQFEGFASIFGPRFYGLPCNTREVVYYQETWRMQEKLGFGKACVIPFRSGESVFWKAKIT